jgi:hypothetical protein
MEKQVGQTPTEIPKELWDYFHQLQAEAKTMRLQVFTLLSPQRAVRDFVLKTIAMEKEISSLERQLQVTRKFYAAKIFHAKI